MTDGHAEVKKYRMKKNAKTIFFDFDGVIVDSFKTAFEVSRTIRPWIDFTEDDYLKCFEGNVYEEFSKIDKEQKVDDQFFKIYIPKLFQLPVIKGIPEVLATLSKTYRLIIISSTISSPIREWLDGYGLAKYFSEIMGGDIHKIKLEKIKMIFGKYRINSDGCVFITDTLGDLREAKKAGLNCLAVTYGFHGKDTLQKGRPAGFIKTPRDIPIEIEKYWKNIKSAMANKAKKKSTKCIIQYDNEVLFIKHRDWPKGWVLPGGTVEKDETPEEGVLREIKEEVSVTLSRVQKIGELQLDEESLTVFKCIILNKKGIKVDGVEATKVKWFKLSELPFHLGTRTKEVIALWSR